MKFLIKSIFLSLLFIFGSTAFAETFPSAPYIPSVSLSNLKLDKSSYQKGDIVTGTFDLTNKEDFEIPLNYQVSLVGDVKNSIPNVEYDLGDLVQLKASVKSKKEIHFSYTLKNAPDDSNSGILVSIVTGGGIELSWKSIPIKILGGISYLTPVEAFVGYDNKKFDLQQGPTVSSSGDTTFNVSLYNGSKDAYDLYPILNLEDKTFSPVSDFKEVNLPVLKIAPLSTSTLKYSLPVKGLKSGVYLAKFTFVDSKKVSRAPVLYARYIIAGDTVSIIGVTSNTSLPLRESDSLNVDMAYTGRPIDITSNNTVSTTTAQIAVEVKNEKGETVMSYKGEKQFGLFGVVNVKGNSAIFSKSLTVDVVVTDASNQILSTYKGPIAFSSVYADKKTDSDGQYLVEINNPAPESKKNYTTLIVVAFVVLILLIAIALIIRKKRLATALVLVGFGLFTYSAQAGFIVVSSVSTHSYAQAPLVTGDLIPDVLYPGESYTVTGSIQSWACNNSYSDVYAVGYVFKDNVNMTKSDRAAVPFNASHGSYSHITRFATTGRAPSNPDTYSYKLDVTSRMYWDGNVYSGYQSGVSGFWPFTVVSNSINNLSYYCQNATTTSVTWSPVLPVDKYVLNIGSIGTKEVKTNSYQFDSESGGNYNVSVKSCQDGFCGSASTISTKCEDSCISSSLVCSTSESNKVLDNCGHVEEVCSEGDICSNGACRKTSTVKNTGTNKANTQCNLTASSTSIFDNEGNFVKSCSEGDACFDGYCTSTSSFSTDPPKINFRGRVHTSSDSYVWKTAYPNLGITIAKGQSLDLDWVITGSFSDMSCKTQNIKSSIGYGGGWTTEQNNQTTDYIITCTNNYGSDSKKIKAVVYQTVEF